MGRPPARREAGQKASRRTRRRRKLGALRPRRQPVGRPQRPAERQRSGGTDRGLHGRAVGDRVYERFGLQFPLLIKYLDVQQPLSVQVHPNDDLAAERHGSYGKTEMWYVVDCGPDAALRVGFDGPSPENSTPNTSSEARFPNLWQKPAYIRGIRSSSRPARSTRSKAAC